MLKSQDILIALKLVVLGGRKLSRQQLGKELHMSASEVHAGLARLQKSRLITSEEKLHRAALFEFLVHGLKYVFPPEHGSLTSGIETSYAATPINERIVQSASDMVPVWTHPLGERLGYELKPLYRSAPDAALDDPKLYELLALVDALRDGRARERKLAVNFLEKRLLS